MSIISLRFAGAGTGSWPRCAGRCIGWQGRRHPISHNRDSWVIPSDFGFGLWVVYTVWGAVIVMLDPVCRWYAQSKQRRRDWWLSYL